MSIGLTFIGFRLSFLFVNVNIYLFFVDAEQFLSIDVEHTSFLLIRDTPFVFVDVENSVY